MAKKDSNEKIEFKGNEFVTAEQQRGYATLIDEMKNDPRIGKLMIGHDWAKINALISFLILKKLEQ